MLAHSTLDLNGAISSKDKSDKLYTHIRGESDPLLYKLQVEVVLV